MSWSLPRSLPHRLCLLGAVVCVATAGPASAKLLARVVPAKFNLTTRPGAPLARDIAILNEGDAPVVVRVRLCDWRLDEAGALSLAPAGSTANTLDGLVEFEPAEFSLQPGETGLVHALLRMPADGPATRWGLLLSEVRPTDPQVPRLGPRAIAELGTTLYLSRVPADHVRADVIGMNVTPLGTDSISVTVRMQNAGERHFYFGGEIALSDSSGARLRTGRLPSGVVLPGGSRNLTWTCAAGLSPGRYLLTAVLDTGQPELIVGEAWFDWSAPRPGAVAVATRLSR